MCQALIDIKNMGVVEANVNAILCSMEPYQVSIEKAMSGLRIPKTEWDKYRELVAKAQAEQENVA